MRNDSIKDMSTKLKDMTNSELSSALLDILYNEKKSLYESGSYSLHDLLMLSTLEEILEARGTHITNPIIPTPYGNISPDLEDCNYVNVWLSEDKYLNIVTCPSCGSGGIVVLSRKHNPQLIEDSSTLLFDRFFCISCQDSWCYEKEH